MKRVLKRIVSGVFYVGLCGATGAGLVIAASAVTSGPIYSRVLFGGLIVAAFILGWKAEGGGSDRETGEETDAA